MLSEHVILSERSRVHEKVDALASRQLALKNKVLFIEVTCGELVCSSKWRKMSQKISLYCAERRFSSGLLRAGRQHESSRSSQPLWFSAQGWNSSFSTNRTGTAPFCAVDSCDRSGLFQLFSMSFPGLEQEFRGDATRLSPQEISRVSPGAHVM